MNKVTSLLQKTNGQLPARIFWLELWKAGFDCKENHRFDYREVYDQVITGILKVLQKECGTIEELTRKYGLDNQWCLTIAHRLAPDKTWAWNLGIVEDAAYWIRYKQIVEGSGGEKT